MYLFGSALSLHCHTQAFSEPEHFLSLALSPCSEQGYSPLQCKGFSAWRLLLLQSVGSRHAGFGSSRALWFTGLVTLQQHVGSSWARN